MKFFVSFLAVFGIANLAHAENIAVIEFNPTIKTGANETLKENINEVRMKVNDLRDKAQLLVFPAYGLTGEITNYNDFKVAIPDEAADKSTYKDFVLDLSNIAYEGTINIIVSLIERGSDGKLYNTAVLFNSKGIIQAKYRKRNLSKTEKDNGLSAGNEAKTITFQTYSYGLVFDDDLFTNPPASTVDGIIVLSSWNNMLPYRTALSVFAGYSWSSQKNVFVASLNAPAFGKSGSGIFVYQNNGTLTTDLYVTGQNGNKVVLDDVKPSNMERKASPSLRALPGVDTLKDLRLQKDIHIQNNNVMEAQDNTKIVTEYVECNLSTKSTIDSTKYKFVVDEGFEIQIGQQKFKTVFCGLVTYSDSNYGSRVQTNTQSSITIEVSQTGDKKGTIYPISLGYNLQPLSSTKFTKNSNSMAKIEGTDMTDVVSFGFLILGENRKGAASFVSVNIALLLVTSLIMLFYR